MRGLLGILIFFAWCLANAACKVVDDLGHVVTLPHDAKRIVSLAPDLTEDLFVLGVGNRIVGVMQGSDYPEAAKKIPVIANYHSVDMESLLALHPDLIVTWADGVDVSYLQKWNIPIYVSYPQKLLDVPKTLQKLGCLVGKKNVRNEYSKKYEALQKRYAHKKSLKVFYAVGSNPLITITKRSWINEAIELCGGKNIFADLKGVAPEVTQEAVIFNDPDVIVGASLQGLRAFRITVNPDMIERASPRLIDGVNQLCILMDEARQ